MAENLHKRRFKIQFLPVIVIVSVVMVFTITNGIHKVWNRKGMSGVIRWDIISYYGYLPATFIYDDVSLGFLDNPGFVNDDKFWYVKADNGNKVILTSMGLAYLYSPFFFIANAIAPHIGQAQDGFSPVYQFFLVFSSLFYMIIGLFLLKSILSRYFKPVTTAITLLLITVGTNLYYYATFEAAMSHGYNFVLIIAFLWSVIHWYRRSSIGYTLLTGFLLGLMTLIRPTNLLAVILLILYDISSLKDLWERIRFFLKNAWKIGVMIIAFLIPWIPQFIYWYTLTGHLFYNAYQNTGSAFFFGSPHIIDLLFSYRKGWFLYVPVMFFAMFGLIPLYRRWRKQFWMTVVYVVVMIYVLASWWAWWFGGSYGPRGLIDMYGIMALPLAALIQTSMERRMAVRVITLTLSAFLVFISYYQTQQYYRGIIHYIGMTKKAYWGNFLKLHNAPGFWKSLSIPDFELARKGIYYDYNTGDNWEDLKEMPKASALDSVRKEITSDPKLMKEINHYSRRNDISPDSALNTVVDRVTYMKREGKPF